MSLDTAIQEIANDRREALALSKAAKKEGKQHTYAYQLNRADAFKLALTKIVEGVRKAKASHCEWIKPMYEKKTPPNCHECPESCAGKKIYPTDEQLDEALKGNGQT